MTKPLIIVESPTKIKTIKKYVGNSYNVTATSGHIRDLPPKEIGIDIDKEFQPKYVNIKGKSKFITALKTAAGNTDSIFLAPDPDREGEAIAFHTAHILKKKNRVFHRVLFHELTKKGIHDALNNRSEIDQNKFNAQQTRRVLDRLVGYQISPLLWRKVQGGLSAGRVQSVAVRIICDREKKIQAFIPEEYWSLTANLEGSSPPPFTAKLAKKNGKKIKIVSKEEMDKVLNDLKNENFIVDKISQKVTKRNPLPPFITSKLQQEAINKLRFSAKKTMSVAQQLYEGITLGSAGQVGLITYMRTDSTRIASEAANEALTLINELFGKDYVQDKPRYFKNKNKSQDAHEAIRPTSVYNTPDKVKQFLSKDQFILYSLIWKRFVASQMKQALINQNSIAIKAGEYLFTLSGSSIKFHGFMKLYTAEYEKEDKLNKSDQKQALPKLTEGELLKKGALLPKQHFTQPPPRFSEASLVKELEDNGIGRPSTYATIISTIRDKGYVEFLNRYFKPSELGFIVNDILIESFPAILNVDFTAKLENNLDLIEEGKSISLDILNQFYTPFQKSLEDAKEGMPNIKGVGIDTKITCPECKKHTLHLKIGRNGPFIACNGYPDCPYSRNYLRDEKGKIHPVEPDYEMAEGINCTKCSKPMIVKQGRYGDFLACSGYPTCKNTQSITSPNKDFGPGASTGIKCINKGCNGEIIEKKTKRGKLFYGCNQFPKCDYAIWDKPVNQQCPLCKAPFLVEKTTKKDGTFLKCLTKGCNFKKTEDKKTEDK